MVPKPYQQPYPPTRIAVASEDTFSLVGTLGHPIFISANTPVPQLQERLKLYRQSRQEAGHFGPVDVSLRIPTYVAEDSDRASSEPEASTMQAIRYGAQELSKSAASEEARNRLLGMARIPYSDVLKQRVIYGTPEAVVDRIQEYRENLGINGVVLETNYGGQMPYDRVVNSIRLIAEKVVPEFK